MRDRIGTGALVVLWLAILFFVGGAVDAHVKWFAPYDVTSPPAAPDQFDPEVFAVMAGAIMAVFLFFVVIEQTRLGPPITGMIDVVFAPIRPRLDDMMRAGAAGFLICLWVLGGLILTPELITERVWISWFQAALALCLFTRPLVPLAGVGLAALWALAVTEYGLFHLLDYPIFLGIAAYFVTFAFPATSLYRRRFDILRWGAAITLMWASIEKFAYPGWAFPVLDRFPFLTLGLSKLNFMMLAGIAEFVLAFALVWTPMVRRLSAIFLALIFVAAVIPFGKIDAIGHTMIILILIVIAADRRPVTIPMAAPATIPVTGLTFAFFFSAYYIIQGAL